jgi:hypothetical protein
MRYIIIWSLPYIERSWLLEPQIEGTAEVVTFPEAMEPLVASYRHLAGEHPDWDDYRRTMTAEQRALVQIVRAKRMAGQRPGPSTRLGSLSALYLVRRVCASFSSPVRLS